MHHADRRVAIVDGLYQHADAHQVEDLVEVVTTHGHLLVDRPVVLRPSHHLGGDAVGGKLSLQHVGDLPQRPVAGRRVVRDHAHNLLVLLRLQDGESQVFQLPLHTRHAQAVRQRGDDVERFLRLLRLLLRRQKAHGPHVVQAISHLDHQHARILRHRHDHLADGLRLGRRAERDLVQLGHAVDQFGHLGPEIAGEVVEGVVGVLHRVVQQRRHQRGGVHANFGADGRHRERVRDVRIPRFTENPLVQALRSGIRAVEQFRVSLGVEFAVQRQQRVQHRVCLRPAVARQRPRQTGRHAAHGGACPLHRLVRHS